jgi:hypothetical protein
MVVQSGWGERQGAWGGQSRFEMKLSEIEEDYFSGLIKAKRESTVQDENQEQCNDKVRNVPLAFLSMEKLRSTRSSRRRIER